MYWKSSMFIAKLLLKAKFKDTFECLDPILSPAVHGKMVPGGGGFHLLVLHGA